MPLRKAEHKQELKLNTGFPVKIVTTLDFEMTSIIITEPIDYYSSNKLSTTCFTQQEKHEIFKINLLYD